jgi:hypothetical protein
MTSCQVDLNGGQADTGGRSDKFIFCYQRNDQKITKDNTALISALLTTLTGREIVLEIGADARVRR